MNSLYQSTQELEALWKVLAGDWHELSEVWRDGVQKEYDRDHMNPLYISTRNVVKQMHSLAELLAEAQRTIK